MKEHSTLLGHRGPVYALCPADEGHFISGSGDGSVVRWSLGGNTDGHMIVNVGQAVFSLHLDASSGLLFIGTEGGGMHLVDLAERRELHLYQVHQRGLFRIIRLNDGRFLVAGGDGTISIWHLLPDRSLALQRQIPVIEEKLRDLAASPDGGSVAVACGDGSLRIFDTAHFNELHTLEAHVAPGADPGTIGTGSVCFHPAKPVLISGGKDGFLRFWKAGGTIDPLHAIPAHKGGIYAIAFDAHGRRCATVSRDKTAKVWDAASFDPLLRLDRSAGGHSHSVNALLWHAEGLITASDDRSIRRWTLPQNG
jgi:WD40 repeat protein